MTKLFIPACGDRLTLTKDWTFTLYFESRNVQFAKVRKFVKDDSTYRDLWNNGGGYKSAECTLPAGTVLECDRIYIRNFNKAAKTDEQDFDSITWKIIGTKKNEGRFWAKLKDCNSIEFELPEDASYKERAKVARAEKEAEPWRLSSDEIREVLATAMVGNGPYVKMYEEMRSQAMKYFEDSLTREKPVINALIEKCLENQVKWYNQFRSIEWAAAHYPPMTSKEFIRALFTGYITEYGRGDIGCVHSKRKDGTHVRKFYWSHPSTTYYSSIHDARAAGLAGLSYTVTSDEADQKIIAMEFCKERAPKKE